MKSIPGSYIPVSPTGYQQNSYQFNNSLQIPPTYQQNGYLPPYQNMNPNASMNVNSNKYTHNNGNLLQPPAVNNFLSPSFIKPHTYLA